MQQSMQGCTGRTNTALLSGSTNAAEHAGEGFCPPLLTSCLEIHEFCSCRYAIVGYVSRHAALLLLVGHDLFTRTNEKFGLGSREARKHS